jgi:glycogen debranching enzyme
MTTPQIFNAGTPMPVGGSDNSVTLVEGSTFCLSDRLGNIHHGTSHGLFYRDSRVLSRWELLLDGKPAEPLSVLTTEAFAAQFVQRATPRSGLADSTVLMVRTRILGDEMWETVTIDNLGEENTVVTLELHADADFADLFAVKERRAGAPTMGGEAAVVDGELHFTDRNGHGRGLSISASGDPLVVPGAMTWRVVIAPGQRWKATIVAQPTTVGHYREIKFGPETTAEMCAPSRKIKAWRDTATSLTAEDPVLMQTLQCTESDLGALRIDLGDGTPPYVAAGAPWFMTLFGRDSLLTSWMALPLDPGLALGTLQQLAKKQGTKVDPVTEEQPGRILHEMRRGPVSGQVLGGDIYYGSVDATPLFVMLLAECWRWGVDEGAIRELLPAADAALAWVDEFGDQDGDGFVEYRRATDRGLVNQGWKDSFDGINDKAGHLAQPPIALCEVQGYVYAARLARATLADAFGDHDTASRLRHQAEELKAAFTDAFWVDKEGWYAIALDGGKRQVDALTSNIGHCLWSGIITDEHAAEVIARLSQEDMNSGFGLRTLSSDMGAFNPMSYHNGSVWPHDTAIAVAGLMRYRHVPGAVELAEKLSNGLLDAAERFGGRLPELFCGFPRSQFHSPIPYPTSCSPQAWASAAPLLLVRSFLGLDPHVPHRTLRVMPELPPRWGKLVLADLRLGPVTVHLDAETNTVSARGVPDDWKLITA